MVTLYKYALSNFLFILTGALTLKILDVHGKKMKERPWEEKNRLYKCKCRMHSNGALNPGRLSMGTSKIRLGDRKTTLIGGVS